MKENSERTIIAIGGGGFTHEPDNPLLDRYVLSQSASNAPKISFIPTANSNPAKYIQDFYKAFSRYTCKPSHLDLFHPHTSDLRDYILSQDIIYVGGGNTKSMLAVWREWELDKIFEEAWQEGVILSGVSAGAICWFSEGITASIPGKISSIKGLGILAGACCPHYDTEPARQKTTHERVKAGDIEMAYLIDDNTALHFGDDSIKFVVSSTPNKKASILKMNETIALQVHCLSPHPPFDMNHRKSPEPL